MRTGWWWVVLVVAVFVIAGAAFTVGQLAAMPKDPPKLRLDPPTEQEKELQEIRIVTFDGTLVEATPSPQGWTVRFEQDAKKLELESLEKQAHTFFRDLERTGIKVARTSYEAISSSLKDVWGNELKDIPVFRVELSDEAFQRINWEGFDPKNLQRLADDWWIHDEIRLKEQEKQAKENQQQ